jgi:3D (Asp-Asp-Asp) domain-containing protein
MTSGARLLVAVPLGLVLGVTGCSDSAKTPTSATVTIPPAGAARPAPRAEQPLGAFSITCHTGTGRTASGRPDGPGLAAVDPDVVPLGTKLRVERIGTVTAADRGPAVSGRALDVWAPSSAACTSFGRQKLKVWRPQ